MHIGIIMDGNGRWAANKGLPRSFGHRKGAKQVSEIIKSCPKLGVKHWLYAFSTENWNRAAHEVSSLMRLFRGYLQTKYLDIINNNIKVKFLGDTNPLPKDILKQMKNLELLTKKNNGFFLNIALNYGGRDEIVSVKSAKDLLSNDLKIDQINESLFNNYLDTNGQSNPDFIIRTAGEKSYQIFIMANNLFRINIREKLWPDFTSECLKESIWISKSNKFGLETSSIEKLINH